MNRKKFLMIRSPADLSHPIRKPGHCVQCGELLWDREDDYRGRTGKRASFMLANGTIMDLTMCDGCLETPDFELLWYNVMSGWRSGNADAEFPNIAEAANTNCILALLYTQPWAHVDNESKIAL